MDTCSVAEERVNGRARLVFAEDHRMVAEGIERLLSEEFDLIGVTSDGQTLLDMARRLEPDLILSDINMPDTNGLEVLKNLRAERNMTPFVLLTMHAEPALAGEAMRAGANGYVLKLSAGEDLLKAIRQVLGGGTYVTPSLGGRYLSWQLRELHELTAKQREVLQLVSKGLSSKQVASALGLSVRTVEAHKYTMMQVLDVHSTLALVRRAEELGLLF